VCVCAHANPASSRPALHGACVHARGGVGQHARTLTTRAASVHCVVPRVARACMRVAESLRTRTRLLAGARMQSFTVAGGWGRGVCVYRRALACTRGHGAKCPLRTRIPSHGLPQTHLVGGSTMGTAPSFTTVGRWMAFSTSLLCACVPLAASTSRRPARRHAAGGSMGPRPVMGDARRAVWVEDRF